MSSQQRLFVLAVEALSIGAEFIPGEGWRVTVRSRRQGDSWDEARQVSYDRLSSAELVDVLEIEAPLAVFGSS